MKKTFVSGLAVACAAVGLVAMAAPARAETLTGVLFDGPAVLGDTTVSGVKAGPDPTNPLVVAGIRGGIVQVTVSEPDESGMLLIYDCNDVAADPQPFVVYTTGQTVSNLVRLGDDVAVTDFCFSPTATDWCSRVRPSKRATGKS